MFRAMVRAKRIMRWDEMSQSQQVGSYDKLVEEYKLCKAKNSPTDYIFEYC